MKSWNDILEAMSAGNEQPFTQAYELLIKKFRPIFDSKYHSVDADFDSIFHDKIVEILHRSLNQSLVIKNRTIDGVLYRAIDNRYKEIIRKSKTRKEQAKPILVEFSSLEVLRNFDLKDDMFQEEYHFDTNSQLELLDPIIAALDETGQTIINGLLEGKKDKAIKEELNWKASNPAFSDKKNRTFKKFRKLYYFLKAKSKDGGADIKRYSIN